MTTSRNNNDIPKCGVELIKRFEGCELKAYPDPKTGGEPWTIGWGNTRWMDGSPVKPGQTITAAEADTLLDDSLRKFFWPQIRLITHFADMSDEQRGALLSFAYNLGAGFYGSEGFTTISRLLRNKDWDKVSEALVLYRNPGSDVEAGLKRRRVAEGALWSRGPSKVQIVETNHHCQAGHLAEEGTVTVVRVVGESQNQCGTGAFIHHCRQS